MKWNRLGLAALAVVAAVGIAVAATPLKISTGTSFIPGPRLQDGSDLNVLLTAVNTLRSQVDGTVAIGTCSASGVTPQTCNGRFGQVTTGSLSTAAATAAAAYVINDTQVTASTVVQCSNDGYSGTLTTNGWPELLSCVPGAGTITVTVVNTHPTNALNGTIKIGFTVDN